MIKEVQDTSHMRAISDKIVYTPKNKLNKKMIFTGKRIIFDSSADTTIKSKNKFKIILEDSVGNKREYNSIEELPTDEQKEFLKENGKLNKLFFLIIILMTQATMLRSENTTIVLNGKRKKTRSTK